MRFYRSVFADAFLDFAAKLDVPARLRIAAETALLALPQRVVIALFRRVTYSEV